MRVLIAGCGYVGRALGGMLARQGHEVFGMRRGQGADEALKAAGIQPVQGDVTAPATLRRLPGQFDWVVNAVSSMRGGEDVYRRVYLGGTRCMLDWLSVEGVATYVHLSSTSVYGQTGGEWVDETSATEPAKATARVLVQTEAELSAASRSRGFPAVILRVAGIYGPGRGHKFLNYLKGTATMANGGERWINMIHLDDLASAIGLALRSGRAGEVYNVADDEPATEMAFYAWLAETLGGELPPRASAEAMAGRKRGLTQKRVSNAKLKTELGWVPGYPTFREGYAAEIARLNGRLQD